jgi:hypothetical protein
MTKTQIKATQSRVGTEADGFWGRNSIAACQKHLRDLMPKTNPWPYATTRDLQNFYGVATKNGTNLINLSVEGLGVKYDGKTVRTIHCNAAVGDSLLRIIKELAKVHPEVIGDYNGCFNFRPMRGGSNLSMHAYGAAIDFMAGRNGNKTSWPTRASMPVSVMEIFAKEGWLSAGAFWGRDAMHFQATR